LKKLRYNHILHGYNHFSQTMNTFGGDWTENKIEILVEYAGAYLTIMNTHANKYGWELLYFDGFAGSGEITKGKEEDRKIIVGAAKRILEIEKPRPFDMFYFVEKGADKVDQLKAQTVELYPHKKVYIVKEVCNTKIKGLSKFLTSGKGKKFKALAYIDPCGMQLNWSSLETLQKLSVDVWILVPTGIGLNRLLKNNCEISDEWGAKLELFLGMPKDDILAHFYKKEVTNTLFGVEETKRKEANAIDKSALLYQTRLKTLFAYVSNTYVLKNSSNSIMFHFLMASNNKNAVKIANQIISKYNKKN